MVSSTTSDETEPAVNSPIRQEDLRPFERRALLELKVRLEEAIVKNQLLKPRGGQNNDKRNSRVVAHPYSPENDEMCLISPRTNESPDGYDFKLWEVPLKPSRGHESTDVILLKFLNAREFRVSDALDMIRDTLIWREEFGADDILNEEGLDLPELEKVTFMNGKDRSGQPVCYNMYGAFKDKELYMSTFGDEEKREKFVRWRVRCMERGIRQLSFKSGETASILQVIDLKDCLSHSMKEFRTTTKKVVSILQDNYPEFVSKNIFLNASFRSYAYHALFSHFTSTRSKSKFIFVRPNQITKTLLKYIAPEDIPIQYGGFKREDDKEFSNESGKVSEVSVRAGCIETLEFYIAKPGETLLWDLSVVGWEVNYKEEFVPDDEGSYRVLIQKEKRLEETIRNSYYISEPGKVLITIINRTMKKKRLFHRSKSKPTIPLYNLLQHPHPHPTV
ncbi:hypothetical protein LUZ61_018620 [Rhynchospora tenuis]|uniref:CRAL-TRIO domain-containing protein n=1 Tax=Rhynchospora tenuis TaxID=198213 RepID=A0AAD5Z9R8_9POAL|nr:hypothetical protein LUZ61_018620 [Rhynchospora tenuis]